MSSNRSRTVLRLLAGLALVGTIGIWVATGAHRGWTKTEITEMKRDEITGIDYPETRKGFVAGFEVLALGAGFAVVLAAASLVVGRRRSAA